MGADNFHGRAYYNQGIIGLNIRANYYGRHSEDVLDYGSELALERYNYEWVHVCDGVLTPRKRSLREFILNSTYQYGAPPFAIQLTDWAWRELYEECGGSALQDENGVKYIDFEGIRIYDNEVEHGGN